MMENEDLTQAAGFSADELELLSYMLEEEGIEARPEQVIPPRPSEGEAPLSFAQQRLWFLHQLDPNSAVYNLPLFVRLRGRLDAGALGRALEEIVRRHEALRTTFSLDAAGPVQVIAPEAAVGFEVVDLSSSPADEREARVGQLAAEESRRPFDITAGPLLRARLLRLGDDEHVALLTMHHLVSDGWSMGVFVREMAALYEAFAAGKPSPLAGLPVQYADFAAWQREWLRGEVLETQLDYWRGQLRGAPALELPLDFARPAEQSFRGGQQTLKLPRELGDALEALSRREGVTLFMTLLAAFKVLLARYTRGVDIVVGTPVAGRGRLELEPLIGLFVNTLALRTDLSGEPSFRELLGRVRDVVLGATAHQDVPFERLVEELEPERDLSRQPLFQVVFVLQNAPRQTLEVSGLSLGVQGAEGETAKFDLTLTVHETPGGLVAAIEYNRDLFKPETAARMLGHYETLLRGIVADPSRPLTKLPLVSGEERRQLLAAGRAPLRGGAPAACLHRLFEAQAARTPEATALAHGDARLSYAELDRRAERLARRLRALGVGPEVLVAIYAERSPELIVAIMATLKAGGAYLPLDTAHPAERLAFMLEDARAAVLLTQERLLGSLPPYAGHVVRLDADEDDTRDAAAEAPPPAVSAENPAYVIYTSGSTGRPKGVVITHANVVRLFESTRAWFDFGPEDVWTLFHSYAFDFSVWEIWGALLYGGRLVIAPYEVSRAPEAFHELLKAEGVTVLNQTPSAFQLMRAEEAFEAAEGLALRLVIFGGEALELRSLRAWFARHGDERPQLVNMYGITETTVHVTYRPLTAEDARAADGSVIGGAIPDLDFYLLDEKLELVPFGVAGEICVGGAGLARGYLNRPSLTAQRFVPHPFSPEPGARLYRSGDLARRLPGGEVEYLGRMDEQVKIRGHRIEIGEIEAALAAHESVREAVVLAREDAPGDRRLVAYVTLRGDETAEDLRGHLKTRLPAYMLPAAFVVLGSLPLTTNGKIDRRALPAPGPERPALDSAYRAPRDEVERALAAAWAEVLGVESVGVDDNFFQLGGDSILSVRLVGLARERGLDFSIQQLFRHQTVSELAAELKVAEPAAQRRGTAEPFSLVSEEDRAKLPAGLEDAYPLTMLQAGMFYHMELQPEFPLYHNVDDWRLKARFDREVFERAVAQVVERHAVLRTSFDLSTYTEPLQLVHESATLPVEVADLRHLPAARQEEVLDALVEAEKLNRFDHTRAPLLRFHVHRLTDETFHFTLTESHTIFDGWSLTTTLSEIFTRYTQLLRGKAPAPPPPTVSFADFVRLEREALGSDESRRYWEGVLAGCEVLRVPREEAPAAPRPAERVRAVNVPVSREVSEGLKRLAQEANVPVKSVLLAAHVKALGVFTGQADVMTGLACNGRPEAADGEQVRGLFLNTVPFRVRLPECSWLDLAATAFEAECELLPFRRYPLSAIQRMHGGRQLFETAFNYVHFHGLGSVLRSDEVDVLDGGSRRSEETHYTLSTTFSLDLLSSDVQLNLDFNALELSEGQIESFAGCYANVLRAMAADPSARHHTLSLLPDAERRRVVEEWNETRRDYQLGGSVHALFEEQAAAKPEAHALICGGEPLTYGELDARANRLAHYLRRVGVGPETRVGVLLERSVELVVSVLAVLKAGGVCVPLDPQSPEERLRFMLEDSSVEVLLTQESPSGAWAGGAFEEAGVNSPRVVALGGVERELAQESAQSPEVSAGPDNLAFIIYTSGADGGPRGAMNTHRGVRNRLLWMREAYGLGASDVVLQEAASRPEAAALDALWPLACGARLVLLSPGAREGTAGLAAEVRERGVTALQVSTTTLRALVDGGEAECPGLRLVLYTGEGLSAEAAGQFLRGPVGVRLENLSGPAEAACGVAALSPTHGRAGRAVTAGRPIANTRIYILDRHMQPVAAGARGEAYVGGAGVGRGYLNRPGLTAERFVPDPFGGEAGGRLFRTGDLARFLPDGGVEHLGRVDEHSGRFAAESRHAETSAAHVAPQTEVERVVADIWRQVLLVDAVGVHDNFFDLGGHSLLLLQVHGKLREKFGPVVSMVEMFQLPTVAAIAERLTRPSGVRPDAPAGEERADVRRRLAGRQRQRRKPGDARES